MVKIVIKEWIEKVKSKFAIASDFLKFLWARKLWWLIPIILILFFFGIILVLSQGSALAPFIYTLF